jgi:diacylglycerol kinase family enzyme
VFAGPLELRLAGADVDDRTLDVVAVEHQSILRLVRAGVSILLRPGRPVRGIHVLRGRVVHVHTGEPLEVTLDGEIAGSLPGTFELVGAALQVITPHEFGDADDPPAPPLQ